MRYNLHTVKFTLLVVQFCEFFSLKTLMFIIDLRIKVKFNAITVKIPCGLKILTFQQGEAQYKIKI